MEEFLTKTQNLSEFLQYNRYSGMKREENVFLQFSFTIVTHDYLND